MTDPDEDDNPFALPAAPSDITDQLPITPEFRSWLADVPLLSPLEIVEALRGLGYRGQDRATKAVALAAHRHVRRAKALFVDEIPRAELPPKQNLLLVGPTGCGKTYLAELLFDGVLQIPTTTVDITAFSESGYIGEDVASLITRLLYGAEGDLLKTTVGVICLDEFDKLASSTNRAVFAGQGTTKDVSGFGVQRELLKLFDGATIPIPTHFSHESYSDKPLIPTHDIAFIACGAFSGLKGLIKREAAGGMAFGRRHADVDREGEEIEKGDKKAKKHDDIAVVYDQEELENVTHFQEYGFLPELIGRFTRIIPFQPLGPTTLREILERNVLSQYRKELSLVDMELEIADAVLGKVVEEALEKQTGARGLRSRIALHLEEAAFEAYSKPGFKKIVLRMDGDKVVAKAE